MTDILKQIVNSIENNKCVLILGPDLYLKEFEGGIIEKKKWFTKIEEDIPNCIYFPDENVFDFKAKDRRAIKNQVCEFYSGEGDIKLYELIASVRFPLILNVSPDSALKDFCKLNGITLQFESFHGFNDEKSSISFDTKNPLLYNLFGNSKDLQELIIDHKQLFKHIQKILPENSLPLKIRQHLSNANCFIFLGFKFNSWIFQLFSYKILNYKNESVNEDDRIRLSYIGLNRDKIQEIELERANNTIKSKTINNENIVNIVMASSVGMEFTDTTPAQLIYEIIDALKVAERKTPGKSLTRDVKNQEKYSVYLSYKHLKNYVEEALFNTGIFTEQFIQLFRTKTQNDAHLKLIIDEDQLYYGESIDSFMTRIGKGKTVILIVSDAYLKSVYCMTEMQRIFKHNNEDKRVFAIVFEDNISNEESYEKFWKDEAKELVSDDKPDVLGITSALGFSNAFQYLWKKLNDSKNLQLKLSDFETTEKNEYKLKMEIQIELEKFISHVIDKLKE
jgi:hypothetical protein